MKDLEEFLPLLLAIIVAIFLFMGFITAVTKSLKAPSRQNRIDSNTELKEQQWRMEEVRRQQKQLLRDQKQKMRDLQRR